MSKGYKGRGWGWGEGEGRIIHVWTEQVVNEDFIRDNYIFMTFNEVSVFLSYSFYWVWFQC